MRQRLPQTPSAEPPPAADADSDAPAAAAPPRRFEREAVIRFSHCDPAGIVFFPQYLVLFNHLVEDWVSDALGIPYAGLIGARRVGLPTVSLQCDFTAVSRMGDRVAFWLEVRRVGGASLHLALGCRQGDEERVRMRQVLVATNLDTHRPIALPDDLREALRAFEPPSTAPSAPPPPPPPPPRSPSSPTS